MQRIEVWYLSSTSSPSVLVWKAIVPLQDVRYIGSDPYVLSIHADEPSWILARSAAHPQVRSRRLNGKVLGYSFFVVFNRIHPPAYNFAQLQPTQLKNQHTSGKKRSAKGKPPNCSG